MRSSKYVLLAVAAALVAVAALALPAAASESVWLKEGKPLEEEVELGLTAGEVIEVSAGTLFCEGGATMTTEGGTTAQVTAYLNEPTCIGLGGSLEGCEVTAVSPKGLPWSVVVNTSDLTAKEVAVSYSFDKSCAVQNVETSFPSLTLTPESQSEIRLFYFKVEKGTAKVDGKSAEITYSGSLNLGEEDFDIYGIG
jgi:hypothetical protein